MSEKEMLRVEVTLEKDKVEKIKSSIDSGARKPSASQAITQALDEFLAAHGRVVLDEDLRREIAMRAGGAVPKNSKDVLNAIEAMTAVHPETMHVDIDPGIAQEIRAQAMDLGFSFQEMAKQILEQTVVDRFSYSVNFRGLFFTPQEWSELLGLLGVKTVPSGKDLLAGIRGLKSGGELPEFAETVASSKEKG
jgi:hypothetical protein